MEATKKKYQTKSAKAETEFVEKLGELDSVAEQVEVLENGIAQIDEMQAQDAGESIKVSPNAESIKKKKTETIDPAEKLKTARENMLKVRRAVSDEQE